MKKRNIIAILTSCAAVLTIFTACGSKEEDVTNPTVVGTDGKVYEEITEAVTDTEGEAVTDAQGETQVVVVTKPYTTKKAEKEKDKDKEKDDKTQAPDENPATPGAADTTANPGAADTTAPLFPFMTEPAGETTTTIDDVLKGEGEEIEVPVDSSGRPQQSMKDKIFKDVAQNKSIFMDCSIVTNDDQVFAANMDMKFYIKNNKVAIEMPLGLQTIRMAFDGKSMNLVFPSAKAYFPAGSAEGSGYDMVDEMGIWTAISSAEMEYVKTAKVDGLICETYKDQTGSLAKYYFDSTGNLKRMEIISPEGASTIFKIKAVSTSVDDSVFSVPNGYTKFSEENFESMAGMLGIK